MAAIAIDESLQVRVRKAHPPEGRSSRHPSAHKGAKTGCVPTLRNAASSQKHCSVACKARVKQVRPWTYPSMVYVPLCTKLEMSDINRGNFLLRRPYSWKKMPKGVMGALMEIASPGQYDIHLVHAEGVHTRRG